MIRGGSGRPDGEPIAERRARRVCSMTPRAHQHVSIELKQHPGVAEDVRLDVAQVEEFGDTDVVGPAHLLVHLGGHRRALDLGEPVAPKNSISKVSTNIRSQVQFAGDVEQAGRRSRVRCLGP